jgi:hypothetical protein
MIRKTMIGLSLFALMTGSALAATPTSKHVSKPRTVAAAPAGDMKEPAKADAPKTDAPKTDAPKADAPKTDAKKKATKKDKAAKTDAPKTEGAKEMKAAAPETK